MTKATDDRPKAKARYYKTGDGATLLNVSIPTVYSLFEARKLKPVRIGQQVRSHRKIRAIRASYPQRVRRVMSALPARLRKLLAAPDKPLPAKHCHARVWLAPREVAQRIDMAEELGVCCLLTQLDGDEVVTTFAINAGLDYREVSARTPHASGCGAHWRAVSPVNSPMNNQERKDSNSQHEKTRPGPCFYVVQKH